MPTAIARHRPRRPPRRGPGPRPSRRQPPRSAIGSRVVEGGTPGRALMSVACRARASGRWRATTMWSAPVEAASSSTMAPTIASSDTERDRPDRIRANDSASSRRPVSRASTASRWRNAVIATSARSATTTQSRGRAPSATRRATRRSPRRRMVPAKIHHERRIGDSMGVPSWAWSRVGSLTSDIQDGGPGPSSPDRAGVLPSVRGPVLSY